MNSGLPTPSQMRDSLPRCPACGQSVGKIEREERTHKCENGQVSVEWVWTVTFLCEMCFESYDDDGEGWFVSAGCVDVFNDHGDELLLKLRNL